MQHSTRGTPRSVVPGMVSIVIPCYRGARYLPDAIESCLRQTYCGIEVLVVDDGSPDDCAEIAERYAIRDARIRVVRRELNGGVSAAFNTGFELARGEYFMRLAQDDIFRDDAVERMREFLSARPECGLVYCDAEVIDADANIIGRRRRPGPTKALRWRNDIGNCVMWRRAVWEALGGFSSEFDTAEDFEYWLRIASNFKIDRYPDCALNFVRVHSSAGSVVFYEKQSAATIRVLKRAKRVGANGHRINLRKGLGYEAFAIAREYHSQHRPRKALGSLLRSFWLWPLPFRLSETTSHLARLRLFVNAIKRILFV